MSTQEPRSSVGWTRREALKKTIYYTSSVFAGVSPFNSSFAAEATAAAEGATLDLLAVGDFGSKNADQEAVAAAMKQFAGQLKQPVDAVLALGDNFYGRMTPDRFERDFENMYDRKVLNCPFYACIGNHDHELVSFGLKPEPKKFEVQLDYARDHPQSRWKMPALWYSFELPDATNPLLKVIVLESNLSEGYLTPQQKLAQSRWLEAELAKPTRATWRWLMMHHPPFTETTKRQDNPRLLRLLERALKEEQISLCIGGHDHNLQHLRIEGYDSHFIVSGAGGARRYHTGAARGFTKETLGFNHFHLNQEWFQAHFVDENGRLLHRFHRMKDGRVQIDS